MFHSPYTLSSGMISVCEALTPQRTATRLSRLSHPVSEGPCLVLENTERKKPIQQSFCLLPILEKGTDTPRPNGLAPPSSASMSQIVKAPVQSLSLWIQLHRQTKPCRPGRPQTALWVSFLHCYWEKYKLSFPKPSKRSEFGNETLSLGLPWLSSMWKEVRWRPSLLASVRQLLTWTGGIHGTNSTLHPESTSNSEDLVFCAR